jgi:hypothetical protein
MANVRNLKRDINYVTSELIIECLTFDYLLPEDNKHELSALITDTLKFRTEMLDKVNKIKGVETTGRGKAYHAIRKSVDQTATDLVHRLVKLNKK